MITRNLWTEIGLCDGPMGTVSDTAYKQGDHPSALTTAVIIKFDDIYTGPSFCSDLPKCVPIIPETSESDLHRTSHERQNSPLRLPWAITSHK